MNVRTDFPGGNGSHFNFISPNILRFQADRKGGPYSMWFHFLVENSGCQELCCEMVHGETALCWPYKNYVRPVFKRSGETWQRATEHSKVDETAGKFRFTVPCSDKTTGIAFCYPYQQVDWQRFCREFLLPAGARKVPLGKSKNGRPISAWETGRGKKHVLLTARAHAGETPGSYVLEGVISGLFSLSKEKFTLQIIPFLDLDGVVEGKYGKNNPPDDFNQGWGPKTVNPEIVLYKNYLITTAENLVVALDCHAPTANDPHFLDCTVSTEVPRGFKNRFQQLTESVVRECRKNPETELSSKLTGPHPEWFLPEGVEESQAGYLQVNYGTLAFILEISYQLTGTGLAVGPAEWFRLGTAVAKGIANYLMKER